MGRTFIIVACALALAECAKPVWNKPGASPQDYAAAHDACTAEAQQHNYVGEGLFGSGVFSEMNLPSYYRKCMDAKGWYQETKIWGFLGDMHN